MVCTPYITDATHLIHESKKTQLLEFEPHRFLDNDYTSTSPPIRSYSSLSMLVQGYVLGSRYIISFRVLRETLFFAVPANFTICTHFISFTTNSSTQPLDSRPPAD